MQVFPPCSQIMGDRHKHFSVKLTCTTHSGSRNSLRSNHIGHIRKVTRVTLALRRKKALHVWSASGACRAYFVEINQFDQNILVLKNKRSQRRVRREDTFDKCEISENSTPGFNQEQLTLTLSQATILGTLKVRPMLCFYKKHLSQLPHRLLF